MNLEKKIEQLIIDCANNKREAQNALYKMYYSLFMRLCLRYTQSNDEAASVLNEAFLKIFTKINTYTFEGSFEGWMRRIVVNTALDHLKKEKKYSEHLDLEKAEFEFSPVDTTTIEAKEIVKMIQALPAMQSQVFNLFAIEGYSHTEIGTMLDISEANSKWHLFSARKNLQQQLNNQRYEN